MRWIKLTQFDGTPLWLNGDALVSMTINPHGETDLDLMDDGGGCTVQQSPAQVLDLIKKAKST